MTDKQLLKIVTGFRKGILGKNKPYLMCYAVSAQLQLYLALLGINCELINKNYDNLYNHVWLKLPDGIIIDATASQLIDPISGNNMPDVYIGYLPQWYNEGLEFSL